MLPWGFFFFKIKSSIKKYNSNFVQKNSPLMWKLMSTPCAWTQSLLQTMSPWPLLLPLWLCPVPCHAQTPTAAMGPAAACAQFLLFLPSAPLKWRRPPPPSRATSGSSNRRNRRTASRWKRRDGERGFGAGRWGTAHRGMDELCADTHTHMLMHTHVQMYIHSHWVELD